MNLTCTHCGAFHWMAERVTASSRVNPVFTNCCKKGDVVLQHLRPPPAYLHYLLTSLDAQAKHFRTEIRKYNSALAFTSIKYIMDERLKHAISGIQCFQIHGELFHLQGPLQGVDSRAAQFAQLYFYDPEFATEIRANRYNGALQSSVLRQITEELMICNPFIGIYKSAKERLDITTPNEQMLRIILNPQLKLIVEYGADKRQANLPTSQEIAIIIPDEYTDAGCRDIVLAERNSNAFTTINPNNAAYMPLHYVLLFPYGEHGWHWALQLRNEDGRRQRTRLSQRTYYRFCLHVRLNEPTTLFCAQHLFQQFIVDAWAICDQNKLTWLRSNQASLFE